MRRGSSLTGVDGSRNFLRSCAFSCAATQTQELNITISNAVVFVFMARFKFTVISPQADLPARFISQVAIFRRRKMIVVRAAYRKTHGNPRNGKTRSYLPRSVRLFAGTGDTGTGSRDTWPQKKLLYPGTVFLGILLTRRCPPSTVGLNDQP